MKLLFWDWNETWNGTSSISKFLELERNEFQYSGEVTERNEFLKTGMIFRFLSQNWAFPKLRITWNSDKFYQNSAKFLPKLRLSESNEIKYLLSHTVVRKLYQLITDFLFKFLQIFLLYNILYKN